MEIKEKNPEEAVLSDRGYLCRRVLGQGAFSKVYWVQQRTGSRSCACKISRNVRMLEREARSMSGLKHPLFPMFFEMWQEEGGGFPADGVYTRGQHRGDASEERVFFPAADGARGDGAGGGAFLSP